MGPGVLIDDPALRDRKAVFADRVDGAGVLAVMLGQYRGGNGLVLAIPAGGVPVAVNLAEALGLPVDVAVVSKITLPWNTEVGYGAVAFDGTTRLNQSLVTQAGLTEAQIDEGVTRTAEKVRRRVQRFRGDRPWPDLAGRPVILVDDGLASGCTMFVAVEAVRAAGADHVVIAVPTAHTESAQRFAGAVEALFVANLRGGWQYAVASAYQKLTDVDEDDALRLLHGALEPNG
jgi:predicted phosphoribosyltransferase